jgi:hypothetical protein
LRRVAPESADELARASVDLRCVLLIQAEFDPPGSVTEQRADAVEQLVRSSFDRTGASIATTKTEAGGAESRPPKPRDPTQPIELVGIYPRPLDAVKAALALLTELERFDGEGHPGDGQLITRMAVGRGSVQAAERTRALLESAEPGDILLDRTVQHLLGPLAIGEESDGSGFRVYALGAGTPEASWPPLGTVLSVAGAATALAAWVAVVGGATMWARFHAAGVPAGEGVAVLPRTVLLAQGLRTLLVPLTVAAVAAAIVQLTRTEGGRAFARRTTRAASEAPVVVGAAVIAVLTILFVVRLLLAVHGWYFLGMLGWIVIGVLGVVSVVILVLETRSPRWLAAAFFAFAALWSGVLLMLREAGSKHPRLEVARVVRRAGLGPVDGLFVARGNDAVFVGGHAGSRGCGIEIVPAADVRLVLIGASAVAAQANDPKAKQHSRTECLPVSNNGKQSATPTTVQVTTTIAGATTTVAGVTTTVPGPTKTIIQRVPTKTPRLLISRFRFLPDPATPGKPVRATFWVADTTGRPVKGALIYVLALAYARAVPIWAASGVGGQVVVSLPLPHVLSQGGGHVVVFVRAQRPGENILDGVSTRRLFQFRVQH